jgi:hypothetical protein
VEILVRQGGHAARYLVDAQRQRLEPRLEDPGFHLSAALAERLTLGRVVVDPVGPSDAHGAEPSGEDPNRQGPPEANIPAAKCRRA